MKNNHVLKRLIKAYDSESSFRIRLKAPSDCSASDFTLWLLSKDPDAQNHRNTL